jgi:hypothetical protein
MANALIVSIALAVYLPSGKPDELGHFRPLTRAGCPRLTTASGQPALAAELIGKEDPQQAAGGSTLCACAHVAADGSAQEP